MGRDGYGEGPRTDLEGLQWHGRSGMGMEDLGLVRRAWDGWRA